MEKRTHTKKGSKKKKIGLPPGSLIYTGVSTENSKLEIIHLGEKKASLHLPNNIENLLQTIDSNEKYWIRVVGLNQIENIDKIGQHFNVSPMILEDILDVEQRPRSESFDDFIFFTIKMQKGDILNKDHQLLSILLTDKCVITFQEEENKWLSDYISNIIDNKSTVLGKPIDYLFYRIIDTIVDTYFIRLETIGDEIEELEVNIDAKVKDEDLKSIQSLKKQLVMFRRSVFPLRETMSSLIKSDNFLSDKTKHYLSDSYENVIHILETIELYRDLSSNLMDLYLTGISNRMNEVMKVLTIIATIFIPLTFITGIYGMNFQYMPELSFHYGYPIALIIMGLIVISMALYFKKKKWW